MPPSITGTMFCACVFLHRQLQNSMITCLNKYHMAQIFDREKYWRIWWIFINSSTFSLSKFSTDNLLLFACQTTLHARHYRHFSLSKYIYISIAKWKNGGLAIATREFQTDQQSCAITSMENILSMTCASSCFHVT